MNLDPRAHDRDPARTSSRTLALFSLWVALVGAFAEVLVVYSRIRRDPMMALGADFVWMAPLALVAMVIAIVTVSLALGRLWRRGPATTAGLFGAVFVVALNLLMLVTGLAHYAAAVLAAGLAVQVTRRVGVGHAGAARLMRGSTVWLIGCFAVAAWLMWTSLHEVVAGPGGASGKTLAAGGTPSKPPNVILITLDTVRAANLSVYGYARATSPNLQRLATRGVVFEDAQSTAPWTLPSHASMLTGRWPHELSTTAAAPLDGAYPTLAEYLGAQGYRTGGFVANLKYCGARTGLERGFDQYEDYPRSLGEMASSSTLIRTVANNFRLRQLIQNDQHLNRVSAPDLNARALAWMSAQNGSPFFAFLNYFDAHEPYLPPPPFDRPFGPGRALGRHSPLHHWLWNPAVDHQPMSEATRREELDAYDGSLLYLDHYVGELVDELTRRGLLENTVVVITADHGEEFAEHGVYEHGYSLYKPGVHVPFIVVAPGRAPEELRVATPVSLRDLAATVVGLAGFGGGAPFPGTSLAKLWRQDGPASLTGSDAPSPVFSEVSPSPGQPDWFPSSKGDMRAIVYQGLRYIRNGDGREELYNFARDPWERENLAGRPEQQAALVGARTALGRVIAGTGTK